MATDEELPPQSMPDPDVAAAVGRDPAAKRKRWIRRSIALLVVLALAGGGYGYWVTRPKPTLAAQYQTQKAEKGSLHVVVTATGTLEAKDLVDVGAEITGRVLEVNVQFNDQVKAGQVLAEIDPEKFEAQVLQARARLSAARASYSNAKTSALEAKRQLDRTRGLHKDGLASDADLETAQAAHNRAAASVKSASADVKVARASVQVADSDMARTIVKSPIDGIVLDRTVEPGQTVTSGLQTPVLFKLSSDLTKMRLVIDIDEADVGKVRAGQSASFAVDAFPSRKFASKVLAVKNVPTEGEAVVSYEAWLEVDNTERLLRPGMTATATIVVEERKNVLLVPNAALRFRPPDETADDKSNVSLGRALQGRGRRFGGKSRGKSSGRGQGKREGSNSSSNTRRGRGGGPPKKVYVLEGDTLKPLRVRVGVTDGTQTEVVKGELMEGAEVVVNMARAVEEKK